MPNHIDTQAIYSSAHFKWPERFRFLRLLKNSSDIKLIHFFCNPSIFKSLLVKIAAKGEIKIIKTMPTFKELRLKPFLLKIAIKSDRVIAYSQYSKNKLEAAGINNVQLIRPGIDTEKFRPIDSRASKSLKTDLGIDTSDFVITYPGEYLRLGDMDTIVKTIIQISSQIKSMKLVLACRIRNKQEADKKLEIIQTFKEAGLESSVIYTDTVADMAALFNLSDIVMFPAEKMSRGKFVIPLAVIEAMACAKPVIISDIDELAELSQNNNLLTIQAGSSDDLADKIMYLYHSKETRDEIGDNARDYVVANFNIDNTTYEHQKLYSKLI